MLHARHYYSIAPWGSYILAPTASENWWKISSRTTYLCLAYSALSRIIIALSLPALKSRTRIYMHNRRKLHITARECVHAVRKLLTAFALVPLSSILMLSSYVYMCIYFSAARRESCFSNVIIVITTGLSEAFSYESPRTLSRVQFLLKKLLRFFGIVKLQVAFVLFLQTSVSFSKSQNFPSEMFFRSPDPAHNGFEGVEKAAVIGRSFLRKKRSRAARRVC